MTVQFEGSRKPPTNVFTSSLVLTEDSLEDVTKNEKIYTCQIHSAHQEALACC